MVDIFVFCTEIEIVFAGLISKYVDVVKELMHVLKYKLDRDTIHRLARIEFDFLPKWFHKRIKYVVFDIWRRIEPPIVIFVGEAITWRR